MKKFTTIILAVLLMMLMTVPALAEETTEVTEATEEEGLFTFADGHISGSYESDGLVNIYLNDELAGGSTLNIPISAEEEGLYTVKVYENGVLVYTQEVQAGAQEPIVDPEDPGTEDPGTDEPGTEDPGTDQPSDNPTPTPGTTDNTNTNTNTNTSTNTSTNTNSGTKTATNVPKTGDAENMGAFMVLGLGAALTLVAAKRVKSR